MTDEEKREALESIALIKGLVDQSWKEMTDSGRGWISIVWGLFALIGYAGFHVLHSAGLYLLGRIWWPFLAAIAFTLSVLVIRKTTATQSPKLKGTLTKWFALFWIPLFLLMGALVLLCGLLPDLPTKFIVPFILLVVSTGYMMIGLLFDKRILVMGIAGFAGTVATALFFIERAGFILAALFGVGLIIAGLLMNRKG